MAAHHVCITNEAGLFCPGTLFLGKAKDGKKFIFCMTDFLLSYCHFLIATTTVPRVWPPRWFKKIWDKIWDRQTDKQTNRHTGSDVELRSATKNWPSINSLFCILALYIAYFWYLQVWKSSYVYLFVNFELASIHSLFYILASTKKMLFLFKTSTTKVM